MLAKQKKRKRGSVQFVAASDIFLSLMRRLSENSKKTQGRDHSGRNKISSTYPKLTQLGLTQRYFSHFASFKSDSGWAFAVAVSVLLIPEPHES